MDAYKNAHVNMIDNVLLLLEQKKADILPFAPAIESDHSALIDKRAAITVALGKAYISTTAVTERKQATRTTVVTVGRRLAAAAMGHANSVKDTTLRKEFKNFKTQLNAVKDADLSVVAVNLQTKLQEVAKALTARGVSADDLANFAAATIQFKADVPTVKNTRDASSTENAEAKKLIVEAHDIIVFQIGGTLEHIQDKIPAIYAAFSKAAELQKAHVAKTEVTITVVDGVTNQKLTNFSTRQTLPQNAKQKAAKQAPKTMQARTSATGEAVWKKNITRNQALEIVHEGYETAFVTLPNFKIGKKHTLEVRLTPLAA